MQHKLLSWALIGTDPVRRRPGIRVRLAALVIAAAGHDILAKLMYAWMLPAGRWGRSCCTTAAPPSA